MDGNRWIDRYSQIDPIDLPSDFVQDLPFVRLPTTSPGAGGLVLTLGLRSDSQAWRLNGPVAEALRYVYNTIP